ncbi:hypothetical protein FQA39_LY08393 [Lamprigera yunnana]|nr:hypothetical protein FQA39_LY08393 [Lamprigera yunnana]
MSLDVSWNSEQDNILINFVKNHELLYNVKCKGYRKGHLKQNIWREIAAVLNKTGKIYLGDTPKDISFSGSVKRAVEMGGGVTEPVGIVASSNGKVAGKTGIIADVLGRLGSSAGILWNITNINTSDAEMITILDNDKDETDVVAENTFKILEQDYVQYNITPEEFQNSNYNSGSKKEQHLQLSKKWKALSKSNERLKLLQQIVDQQRQTLPEDETDLFFASMAKIVKKLPECERVRLRMEINVLIGNTELKCLTQKTDTCSTSAARTTSSSSSSSSSSSTSSNDTI